MSNFREQKKRRNRENILASARSIFAKQGYHATTVAQIAEKAQIATGTIYNYYSSKGAILMDSILDEFVSFDAKKMLQQAAEQQDSVTAIITVLQGGTAMFALYPKAVWREIFAVMLQEAEESRILRKGLFGMDAEVMEWIKSLLIKNRHQFSVSINEDTAIQAIYATAMLQTIVFIYNDPITLEQYGRQLAAQIQFLFSGKLRKERKD